MQPVKITILGNYYDCQIYRGRLYLWTFEGALRIYDWGTLVRSLIKKEKDELAIVSAFLDGKYLYEENLKRIFKDTDLKNVLHKKFIGIENKKIFLTEKNIKKFLLREQDTPRKIIPTDTEIYSNKLYFITEEGLFSSSAHRSLSEKYLVSSRPQKLWDCNLLSIKANKYPQLALSGGDEGLFELNMVGRDDLPKKTKAVEDGYGYSIFNVSNKHSSFANYSYLSVYNTSLIDNSFMALFHWDKRIKTDNVIDLYSLRKQNDVIREFDRNIPDSEIFKDGKTTTSKHNGISWGGATIKSIKRQIVVWRLLVSIIMLKKKMESSCLRD